MKSASIKQKTIAGSAFAYGLVEGVLQIVFFREIFAHFSGMEFIFGILMAGWHLFNAAGCLLAARFLKCVKLQSLVILFLTSCLIIIVCWAGAFLSGALRTVLPGWIRFSLLALIVLFPFCLFSGLLFVLFVRLLNLEQDAVIPRAGTCIYICNSSGMAAGFALTTFILIPACNVIEILAVCISLNLLISFIIRLLLKKPLAKGLCIYIFLFVILGLAVSFRIPDRLLFNLMETDLKIKVKEERLLEGFDSLYSRVMVSRLYDQINFYINGNPTGSFPYFDPAAEKKVHIPLLCVPDPDTVFIAGGILQGNISLALEHNPGQITYCDFDPQVISLIQKYTSHEHVSNDSRTEFCTADPRKWLSSAGKQWDLILIDMPQPADLMFNRFYTLEFFKAVDRALKPDGIFSISIQSAEPYTSENLKNRNSSILEAVKKIFPYHIIIPGAEGIILAAKADNTLRYIEDRMIERFEERKISGALVSPEYISYLFRQSNLALTEKNFRAPGSLYLNRDYYPVAVIFNMLYTNELHYPRLNPFFRWLVKIKFSSFLILISVIFLLLFILRRLTKKPQIIKNSKTGYFCMLLQGMIGFMGVVLFVCLYQVKEGMLYSRVGLLSLAVMAGYSAGSILAGTYKQVKRRNIFILLLILFSFSVVLFLLLKLSGPLLNGYMILFLSLAWGLLNGMSYPFFTRYFFHNAGKPNPVFFLYTFELIGAALAAVMTGFFLLPVFGFINCIFLMVFLEGAAVLMFAF